jgi:hypothetical protein
VNWFVIGPTLASAFASAMSTTLEKAAANRATRGLQVVALHYGALALVQPLLVSGLIFALILRHVGSSSRISARELLWGGALVACPTGFLFFSGATTGGSGSETADPSLLLPEA